MIYFVGSWAFVCFVRGGLVPVGYICCCKTFCGVAHVMYCLFYRVNDLVMRLDVRLRFAWKRNSSERRKRCR